jgi:hypothetical protein
MDSLTPPARGNGVPPAALAFGIPALVLSGLIVAIAIASMGGLVPTARDYQLTLAEAAALHDVAEIVRLVRRGGDPRAPAPVRAGMIGEGSMMLTPMAAAILERRVDVMALLADVGARIRPDEFAQYWCLAQARGDSAVVAAVESQTPRVPPVDCSATATALDEPKE